MTNDFLKKSKIKGTSMKTAPGKTANAEEEPWR